jgi:hypothetical protein
LIVGARVVNSVGQRRRDRAVNRAYSGPVGNRIIAGELWRRQLVVELVIDARTLFPSSLLPFRSANSHNFVGAARNFGSAGAGVVDTRNPFAADTPANALSVSRPAMCHSLSENGGGGMDSSSS